LFSPHQDRNKLKNDPNNLWVFASQEEHDMALDVDTLVYGEKANYQGFDKDKEEDDDDIIEVVVGADVEDYADRGDYNDGDHF
jgi:hypothetical protein